MIKITTPDDRFEAFDLIGGRVFHQWEFPAALGGGISGWVPLHDDPNQQPWQFVDVFAEVAKNDAGRDVVVVTGWGERGKVSPDGKPHEMPWISIYEGAWGPWIDADALSRWVAAQ